MEVNIFYDIYKIIIKHFCLLGKEIWEKVEPLHEEANQETWHSNLIQIILTNKNISTMKNYQSFDF